MGTQQYKLNVRTQSYQIGTHTKIYPLNIHLDSCTWQDATLQLEIYHTMAIPAKKDKNKHIITPGIPSIKIGVIAPATHIQSYSKGDKVKVISKLPVNLGCTLTNIIKTDFLANLIAQQR